MTRRGRRRSLPTSAIPQLPWRQVTNAHGTLDVLRPEQVDQIHDASIQILETSGIELWSADARRLFEEAGAIVDHDTTVVRVGADVIEHALSAAPSSFTLTPRNPDRAVELGGNNIVFGLVAGPPAVHDCINGRRQSNMVDYENFVRLAQYFNAIHMLGTQVSAPMELPANTRHLDCYRANITYSDLAYHCTAIGRGRALDGINMLAISRGLTLEEVADSPGVLTVVNVNSPRRMDGEMADGLIAMAEHGQPVSVTPFTLMGAMTPATLAGALVQANAEALFGIVLTQLAKPGAPVVYGSFTSNVDMRSGAPAFGTPENSKANVAAGQLARRYGLPYRSSNCTAANTVDAQAAYEMQMALWGAVLGGANIVYHAAGWMEGGLQASYEKLILDVEVLQNMMEFLTPVDTSDDQLALDAIARVPTGGHFFGDEHTMERYDTAFYQPMLSDWRTWEQWNEDGARTATERATGIWQTALDEYEAPPLDDAIAEELESYIAHRKEAIGDGEP